MSGGWPRGRLHHGGELCEAHQPEQPALRAVRDLDLDGDASGDEALQQSDRGPDGEVQTPGQRGGGDERHRGQEIDHGCHVAVWTVLAHFW